MRKVIGLLGRGSEGKSTTAHYLALALMKLGHKVTVVSTDNFGGGAPAGNPDATLSGVMAGDCPSALDAVQMATEGYGFISGGDDLDGVAVKFGAKMTGPMVLRDRLSVLDGIIVIDSRAYNPDFWSDSVILASDLLVGVVVPNADSAERLDVMREHVGQAGEVKGISPIWAGFIGTKFSYAKIFGGILTEVSRNAPGDKAHVMKVLAAREDCIGAIPLREGSNKRDIANAYTSIAGRIVIGS